jgi:hypothetical protein
MEVLSNQVAKNGYGFFPAYQPKKSGAQIAGSFGKLLNLGNGDPVHQLVPTTRESATTQYIQRNLRLRAIPFPHRPRPLAEPTSLYNAALRYWI